jgi:CheY-like chemotaxis protein
LILFAMMKNVTTPHRILVVDDDALSRDVLTLLLEHAGYVVETADSGDAAIHHLNTVPGPLPHVVLADLQMPGIAGSALAYALRDRCGEATLLLAMSGAVPAADIIRGFDGLLLKPFTMEELSSAIASHGHAATGSGKAAGRNLSPLDEIIYEKLAGSMRKERLDQLYTLCLEDTEARIARMRKAASKSDSAAFRKEAHAIRGGAGMVGASELRMLAASIEENGIHADHVASLDELLGACTRLQRILMAQKDVGKRAPHYEGECVP